MTTLKNRVNMHSVKHPKVIYVSLHNDKQTWVQNYYHFKVISTQKDRIYKYAYPVRV